MKLQLGRNIYGFGAIAFGIITLMWHQINSLGNISHPIILVYIFGIAELLGGIIIQWEKTKKYGTLIIISVYFIFTIYLIPPIIQKPLIYGNWGNFFEELSIVLGGMLIFVSIIKNDSERLAKVSRIVYLCYGICVVSYSLYQFFYLGYTANLVPKWIPPGQMFWAVTTSIAFALAAFAILSRRFALLASGLLAIMFIGFCLLVWLPLCISDPHNLANWIGNATTLIICGAAWCVFDFIYLLKFSLRTSQAGIASLGE